MTKGKKIYLGEENPGAEVKTETASCVVHKAQRLRQKLEQVIILQDASHMLTDLSVIQNTRRCYRWDELFAGEG